MSLAEHREAFECADDGSLRDLLVLDTTIADWDLVLEHLRASGRSLRFSRDQRETPLPAQAAEIFALREQEATLLVVEVAGMQLHSHFFWREAIDFDLERREVTSKQRYQALLAFMLELGEVTGKRVVLAAEGAEPGRFAPWFDLPAGATWPTFISPGSTPKPEGVHDQQPRSC
jgi:hypothetical protein